MIWKNAPDPALMPAQLCDIDPWIRPQRAAQWSEMPIFIWYSWKAWVWSGNAETSKKARTVVHKQLFKVTAIPTGPFRLTLPLAFKRCS